jgi:hypothetical protein
MRDDHFVGRGFEVGVLTSDSETPNLPKFLRNRRNSLQPVYSLDLVYCTTHSKEEMMEGFLEFESR